MEDTKHEEFESPDECHRMAAYHLTQAAKHHEIAAMDVGDIDVIEEAQAD